MLFTKRLLVLRVREVLSDISTFRSARLIASVIEWHVYELCGNVPREIERYRVSDGKKFCLTIHVIRRVNIFFDNLLSLFVACLELNPPTVSFER